MTLTERIRRAALGAGADLVGFAPISRFDNAPRPLNPRTIYPPTRTVVAVGLRHLRGALKAVEEGTYWQAYNCDNYWYLNEVAAPQVLRAICLALEEDGWDGVPVHNPFHPHTGRAVREDLPDGPDGMVSLRVIGVAAGLGELGVSKLFLSPQFGPRQRIFAVCTNAELEPTPLVEPGTVCDGCRSCARECQADAIGPERAEKIVIDGREYSHAPLDCGACGVVHRGDDPRFSPFWNGKEAEGEKTSYAKFLQHRFRHLAICVGRGCLRACVAHLEKTGRIDKTYREPFMRRERWKLNDPPEKTE